MSAVAARFYVAEITKSAYSKGATKVVLQAVSRGDQNRTWASATPQGRIELTIQAEPAASYFEQHLGDDIEVMFTVVPVATPGDGHAYRPSEAEARSYYGPPKCGECMGLEDEHVTS